MKPAIGIVNLLCAISLSPLFVSTASAQSCVLDCMRYWFCSNPAFGDCVREQNHAREMCEIRCRGVNSAPRTGWGSIAYSAPDHIRGWSFLQDDRAAAERVALQYCNREGGAKCLIRTSFLNTCGAVAADAATVAFGTAAGKAAAEQRSMDECARAGGQHCKVESSVCSGTAAATTSSTPNAPQAPRTISWGAIAYSSKDMGAGWSQAKGDRASAEKEALSVCAQRGKGCVLQTAFNKQCGALAADRDFTGLGVSADQRQAQQQAIDQCKKAGGARCSLHISFCSF